MDSETFQKNFLSATELAIELGHRYLLDELLDSVQYHLYPCQSYDRNTALEMLGMSSLYDYEEVLIFLDPTLLYPVRIVYDHGTNPIYPDHE